MDDFDKHLAQMRNAMIFGLIAKLATVGGLIWLAVYAINAFTG